MTELTPEWRDFLLTGTRTGKLALVRANGTPHVTPVWFLLDDNNELIFTTWGKSVKCRNLLRTRAFSLCVDDDTPPFSYIMLECQVRSIEEQDPALREWATRIGGRYMGVERAEAYGERNSIVGEYLVRSVITRVVAQAGIAS